MKVYVVFDYFFTKGIVKAFESKFDAQQYANKKTEEDPDASQEEPYLVGTLDVCPAKSYNNIMDRDS